MATAEKLRAAEKLLSRLSERRKSIIEHVKQQTESYGQHLASKLLIKGIDPPAWLRDPSASGSKEINEEELISKLLSQYPQPSACWSVSRYPGNDNLVVSGDHKKYSEGDFLENAAPNKDLGQTNHLAGPSLTSEDHGECALYTLPELDISVALPEDQTDESISGIEDHGECALDTVPELDFSAASPKGQTDERISDEYSIPDQSLVRIQRSKSRQKALELRSSVKAPSKSGSRHDSISDVVSSQIRFSLSIANHPSQNGELSQLVEPCKLDTLSCDNRNVVGAHCLIREMGVIGSSKRIIRSETQAEAPNPAIDSFPLGCSSDDHEENASSQNSRERSNEFVPISDSQHVGNQVNKSPKSAGPSAVCGQSFRDGGEEDANFLCKDEGNNVYSGEFSTSGFSSRGQGWDCLSTKADTSFENHLGINITKIDSGNEIPRDYTHGSPMKIHLSDVRNEGCDSGEPLSKDYARCKERDAFLSPGSIQCNACNDEISDLEVPRASAKVCGSILVASTAGSGRQVNDSQELSRLVKPSGGLFCRLTRSKSRSYGKETYHSVTYNEIPSVEGTESISDCKEKCDEVLQNSIGQLVPSYLGSHKILHDDKNDKLVIASELCLLDHVDKSRLATSNYSMPSLELESEVAMTTSDSFAPEEPRQVELEETDVSNLESYTSRSGKKKTCSFHDPDVSLDKGICGGDSQPSSSRQLPGMSDISSKEERAHIETDVYNLESYTSRSVKKKTCPFHDPDVSLDKDICGGDSQLSSSRQLPGMSDISSKEERARIDSFDSDVQECTNTHSANFGPVIGSAMLNIYRDSSEAAPNCRSSEVQDVQHETQDLLSKSVGITDIQIPQVEAKHGIESSPVHCMEQGDCNDETSDKGHLVSSAPESKYPSLSFNHNSAKDPEPKFYGCSMEEEKTDPIAIEGIKQCAVQQSPILSWPEDDVCCEHKESSLGNYSIGKSSPIRLDDKNMSLERRLRYSRIESWPQVKRRKIEHQQAHGFATSQRFRVTKPLTLQRDLDITFPKTMEIDIDNGVDKTTDDGICSEVNTDLMEGIQATILSQHGEVGSCHVKQNEQILTSPVISNEELVASISILAESRNSQEYVTEGTRASPPSCEYLDARMSRGKQCSQNSYALSSQKLNPSHTLLKEIQQSPQGKDGFHLQHSVHSSRKGVLQLTDVDQSMPVFEGFVVNTETDTEELDFAADAFDLCELDLPRSTLERASILAEICRSASLERPSSHFLSAFKFQEPESLCKSVSDDVHLDPKEFGHNYPLDADLGKNFQSLSSSSDDYKDVLDGMTYSSSLAYSGETYGWDLRNQPPSPVGKLWSQLSSLTGSSGKCSSSNPELTCFPIEEDPSSSQENMSMDENVGDTLDETDSCLASHCDNRQALKDLTNMGTSPGMSIAAEEETLRKNSMDFLKSKFSVTVTHEKALLGPKHQSRKKSEASDKQTSCTRAAYGRKHQLSTIGPNATKRTKESVSNSISKPIVSNKTSLKGQDQKLSLRGSRQNNIVSNVSSFIPLLQQKQAATPCKGKVNVKVKALKAAEAAKREEEKKANERKQRKEALKLERALKLEENNLQMELEKKKREEERKKKEADIIAKKRLREEGEKEKKEKKRMRLEPRARHREQEAKKCVERSEIENQRTKEDQMNSKKELYEFKIPQNRESTRGEGGCLQKTDSNLTLNELVVNHEECGTSGLSCDGEAIHAVDRSPIKEDLIVQNNNGKSYEISPYQSSDDEDDEDEELPTKKYIPSWASKSSIARLLPFQLKLDPDVIFPRDSFCRIEKVLLPRKLQQKQVAL